jgi:ABC-type transport system involved in cytochrome c biogenesis permease component
MNPDLREIVAVTLRMYLRNRMALAYSYVFPVMFLLAFLVLYKDEQPLLIQHMGELLTVTILGGACFGLPTSMVSEREHGVWRRYRLSPVPPGRVIAGTLIARYCMILVAGVLQVAACMLIGGWTPEHPFQLWVAFSLVTFALLGLGLVIAALADTVPAVQALGQCIFLPMLILGGVAVKLSAFEGVPWVLHLSAFFPGRYAVDVMQQCAKGGGLGLAWFSAVAVVLTGFGAGMTGAKLFRWDAHQRFLASRNKGWLVATVAAWILIGVGAEYRREIVPRPARRALPRPAIVPGSPVTDTNPPSPAAQEPTVSAPLAPIVPATAPKESRAEVKAEPVPPSPVVTAAVPPAEPTPDTSPTPAAAANPAPVAAAKSEPPSASTPAPATAAPWRAYTKVDFARLDIANVPPDNGNVTPIAGADEEPDRSQKADLAQIEASLPNWEPAKVTDRVQFVRNVLYIAGTLDESQTNTERFVPYLVLNFLRERIPTEELTQILCWIANHPQEGDDSAVFRIHELGVFANVDDADVPEIRRRNEWYAIKFVWWLLGW